jgi:hypothetical protein
MRPTSTPDPLQVSVGRRLVITTLGLIIGLELVTLGVFLVQSGGEGAATRIVRLLLTLLLSFWIWRGERWARWILVAYVALALMFIAPFLLTADAYAPDRRAGTLVLLAFALLYLAIGRTFLWSESVHAFQAAQRIRYAPQNAAPTV